MSAERDPQPMVQQHRPLPSVDIALLPHERRAARVRLIAGATAATVLLSGSVAGAWLLAGWLRGSGEANPDSSQRAAPMRPLRPDDAGAVARAGDAAVGTTQSEPAQASATREGDTRIVQFGSNHGFRKALEHHGVSATDAAGIVEALTDVVDFRRCRPEDELVFERENGELQALEYRVSVTRRYRAERFGGTWEGHQVEVPIETRRIAKGSRISASLGGALESLGLGRSLAGVFVGVFEGHADFHRDTRQGDSVRLIVEEERVDGDFLGYGKVQALEYKGERTGTLRAFWFQPNEDEKGDYYDPDGRSMHGGWLRTPLRYDHISSGFDLRRRHPILKRIVPHTGVDYAAARGTPVWAAAEGRVKFAGRKGANGNLVVIRHDNGYETAYAHLARIARGIRRGAEVEQRQIIGSVGSSGRSTGPHLHFGLRKRGRFVDPIKELNGPGRMMARHALPRYKRKVRKLKARLQKISLQPAPEEEAPPERTPATELHAADY